MYAIRNGLQGGSPTARASAPPSDMRYIMSRECRPIFSRLARERTLCAFDFDGTLAPIVECPDQAAMRDRTRRLLAAVASEYPCIILVRKGTC